MKEQFSLFLYINLTIKRGSRPSFRLLIYGKTIPYDFNLPPGIIRQVTPTNLSNFLEVIYTFFRWWYYFFRYIYCINFCV